MTYVILYAGAAILFFVFFDGCLSQINSDSKRNYARWYVALVGLSVAIFWPLMALVLGVMWLHHLGRKAAAL